MMEAQQQQQQPATNNKYTTQQWSCKDFDEQECQQQIANNLQEQYNTIFDCLFLPADAAGGREGLLLTAHDNGDIRLYNWRQVCSKWLSQRAQQQHELSWRAHEGPVYALAVLHFDGSHLLVTAGCDGHVKLWQLGSILAAAAAAAAGSSCQLQASAEVLLPHLQNPLGISDGRQPAAQALSVDQQHQQVFIGSSDGGVHAWQLPQLAAVAALGSTKQSAAAAAALSLVAMPGHAAAVLGLDYCSATNQLASASEDGTVRVWDCSSHACLAIIHPNPTPSHKDGPGSLIPLDQPALLLKCARSPGNTCVRFDAGGNWLLIGNADGYLVLWSCRLNAVAAHTQCTRSGGSGGSGGVGAVVPQVLQVTPSTIYLAGTDRQLQQYSFQLKHLHSFDVAAESVFGIAHEPVSGMLAVCGSRCCLDLLSAEGNSLGHIRPPASVFLPAPQE